MGCVAGSRLLFSAGSGSAGSSGTSQSQDLRGQFPKLKHEVFLNTDDIDQLIGVLTG